VWTTDFKMNVWSGDFGGHLVGPCCPVHTLCNLLLRHGAQSVPVLQYCVLVKEHLVT